MVWSQALVWKGRSPGERWCCAAVAREKRHGLERSDRNTIDVCIGINHLRYASSTYYTRLSIQGRGLQAALEEAVLACQSGVAVFDGAYDTAPLRRQNTAQELCGVVSWYLDESVVWRSEFRSSSNIA